MSLSFFDESLQEEILKLLVQSYPDIVAAERLEDAFDRESRRLVFNLTYLRDKEQIKHHVIEEKRSPRRHYYSITASGIDRLRLV